MLGIFYESLNNVYMLQSENFFEINNTKEK